MAGYHRWLTHEFDEERDLKGYKCWVLDAKDCVPVWKPFTLWAFQVGAPFGTNYGAEMLSLPTTRGWEFRTKDGYWYFTALERTEDEAKRREPIFRERITPWIEDFGGEWAKCIAEMMGKILSHNSQFVYT